MHEFFTKIAANPLFIFLSVFGAFLALCVCFLILVCIVALFQRILHPNGYESSPKEIRDELQRIIDGKDPYAWDDFTSVPLKDPRLEAIRVRVANLDQEFPSKIKGELYASGGSDIIRGYIQELEKAINLPSAG